MAKYKVIGSKVTLGAGFVLGLSEEQIKTRSLQLKKYGKNHQVIEKVEFKNGEVIDIISKNLTKSTLDNLELLDPVKKIPMEKETNEDKNSKAPKKDV